MKKTVFLSLLLLAALPMTAQQNKMDQRPTHRTAITELVDDLSPIQKRKVEQIDKSSRERVDALRRQKNALNDSITLVMEREGDQSRILFPLFDREARLQAAINREMYQAKCKIDEVLTPAQRARLRTACHKDHQDKVRPVRPIKAAKPELQQRFIKE